MSTTTRVVIATGEQLASLQSWQPTNALRWAMPSQTTTKPAVLEQLWQGSKGDQEWRPVETVVLPISGLSQAPA